MIFLFKPIFIIDEYVSFFTKRARNIVIIHFLRMKWLVVNFQIEFTYESSSTNYTHLFNFWISFMFAWFIILVVILIIEAYLLKTLKFELLIIIIYFISARMPTFQMFIYIFIRYDIYTTSNALAITDKLLLMILVPVHKSISLTIKFLWATNI